MGVVWTPELKAKAAQTRAETKRLKQEALERKQKRLAGRILVVEPQNGTAHVHSLPELIAAASSAKKEYDRLMSEIAKQQSVPQKMWTCWSQENKHLVPKSVLAQCLKQGEDGKWKFRDDGRFVLENGIKVMRPAFVCNYLCYAVYQRNRVTPPAPQKS